MDEYMVDMMLMLDDIKMDRFKEAENCHLDSYIGNFIDIEKMRKRVLEILEDE